MAKPRELFNTPAPQAMSQMGQGIADAYARAGAIEGAGYKALGEGLAQGITQAAGAYSNYKQMSSQVKSAEKFYQSMKDSNAITPEMAKGIDTTINSEEYKNMGTAEKADYWNNVKSFTGNAISNQMAMDKMKAEFGYNQILQNARLGTETANQQARILAGYNMPWVEAQAKSSYPTGSNAMLPGVNPGLFSGIGATPQGMQATQGAMQSNMTPVQPARPAYNPFNQPRQLGIGIIP